jgi:hypothetical protein
MVARGERAVSEPTERLPRPTQTWSRLSPLFSAGRGAYSKEKVGSFHEYCDTNSFPYELW